MESGFDVPFGERHVRDTREVRGHVYAILVQQNYALATVPAVEVSNLVHYIFTNPNLVSREIVARHHDHGAVALRRSGL
ncbi:hypothetical protein GO294_01232 [Ralstonia solanacearum]|nr:hypothetical protein [Ralstonia solanacearum]